VGLVTKQLVKGGNDATWWPRAGMWKCVRVGHGMASQSYCVVGGCLLSLSLCRRGFQDLLKVRPSSLLILCECISRSTASLMSQSMYPVLAERSFVSCSLMMWSWLMLCSATADLSGCASLICLLCSLIQSYGYPNYSQI
jgi:hypothetical protein